MTSSFSPARTLPHTMPAADALLTNGSRTLKHSLGASQAKRNPSRTGATAFLPANGSTTPAAPLSTELSQPVPPARGDYYAARRLILGAPPVREVIAGRDVGLPPDEEVVEGEQALAEGECLPLPLHPSTGHLPDELRGLRLEAPDPEHILTPYPSINPSGVSKSPKARRLNLY